MWIGFDSRRLHHSSFLLHSAAPQHPTLELQGKYMGTRRGLPASKRAKVTKVRVEMGMRAAMRVAGRMAA